MAVPRWRHRAAGWVRALGADPPSVTGKESPPGGEEQPQVTTREGVRCPQLLFAPHDPSQLGSSPTPCWQRGAAAAHPSSRTPNSPSLQLSPAFSLASGSAGNTPPALFTGAKSTLFSAGGVSLHRPGSAGHTGDTGDTGTGCCLVISTKHPRAGAWAGVSAYGEQLSLLTPHPALGSASDKAQPGLVVVIVPSRPYKGCWTQPLRSAGFSPWQSRL